MTRKIVVMLSDTHAGSNVALMGPEVKLVEDGPNGARPYSPDQTESQKYLWELYQSNISDVMDIAGDNEVIVLHNGDVCQGNKFPVGLVSTRPADQFVIAVNNLSEWCKYPQVKTMRLLASTGSHAFGEASADIIVSGWLAEKYGPNTSITPAYHSLFEIEGVRFDMAHHGPFPGSRVWLTGNVAQLYLRDLMIRELGAGKTPPNVVGRAHYHTYLKATSQIGIFDSVLYITPSYSMLGDYAHQAARSPSSVTNGLIALEVVGGRVVGEHILTKTIDIRTKETL